MTYTYEHRGYALVQTSYNWHYMIFDGKGHMLMHASCRKKLTEKKAKEMIDNFIYLQDVMEDELVDDFGGVDND